MTPAARVQAAIEVLDKYRAGMPAEKALTNWARGARYAGSKDRAAVRDHVFDALRCLRSFAALGGGDDGRALMLGMIRAEGGDPETLFTGAGHAPAPLTEAERNAGHPPEGAAAMDLPDWLLPIWQGSLPEAAVQSAMALRHRAPVMLRVNLARASMAQAQTALNSSGIKTETDDIASTALRIIEGPRKLASSPAYLEGLVELQDGSSQALIDELPLPTDGKILDFCAGGGGKALAMAARSKAQVFAHDLHTARLTDLPERARRAGAKIKILPTNALSQTGPFDLVLTDVPCSGSGAWRRSPEAKWALTPERLQELTNTQDTILDQAAALVAADGHLAYATCSVLEVENTNRIQSFVARTSGWKIASLRHWRPSGSGDGFFGAILSRA